MDTQTSQQPITEKSQPPIVENPITENSTRSGSRWWVWVLVVVVLLVGITIWSRRGGDSEAKAGGDPASRPVLVSTATAHRGDIGVFLNALGAVTPVYTVTVTSRVQGEITKVYYREGQMVKKGDPLIEIDPRPYQAALTQVQGQLAHDQAVLSEAKIDLDRYKQALDRNAIAKQQYDDQEQVVFQDEGTVQNDEGQLANAKVNLVYTQITSPIAGRVGLRLVDPGNIVQANSTTSLVVITQLQPITVIFSIAEDSLTAIQQQLRKGKTLTVDAFDRAESTKLASGKLLTLDNVIDPTTGTLKLKAVFDNNDNALFPSQFVNIRLLVDTQHDVTLIPTPAIQRNAQGAYVYVIKSDGGGATASIRTITPSTTDGPSTAVQGLEPNEVVAVNGFDRLLDGAKVTIRQPKAAGTTAGQQPTGQSQAGQAQSGQSQSGQSQSGQSNGSASGGKNGAARQ
ncbi:MAG TPA: efflux RND transporter periplasmic adaptor subunit [Terriglobales bacterium]|jgi:multidrug efflux system membrane fusion protein|nr:efflux RND transporter periplasmic adaptor subunit [Terriglobales bacterium]